MITTWVSTMIRRLLPISTVLLLSACRVWALTDRAASINVPTPMIAAPTGVLSATPTNAPTLTPSAVHRPTSAPPFAFEPVSELDHGIPTVRVTPTLARDAQLDRVRAFAIGDSVMLGAAAEMKKRIVGLEVDAQVSRHIGAAIEIVRQRREADRLGDVVIVHIGDNGPLKAAQLDSLMQLLADVPRVIVVNLKLPRSWEEPNNRLLAEVVARTPNAVLLDWRAATRDKPELFGRDGIHLGLKGARFYAELVAAQVNTP